MQAFSFKVGQNERIDLFLLDFGEEKSLGTCLARGRWHPTKDQWDNTIHTALQAVSK